MYVYTHVYVLEHRSNELYDVDYKYVQVHNSVIIIFPGFMTNYLCLVNSKFQSGRYTECVEPVLN